MAVEGEGRLDARPAHHFKAHAIHEAQGAAPGDQVGARGGFVDLARHPDQAQDRHDVAFEDPDGFQPQPAQDDGRCLDQDIIMADEFIPAIEHLDPSGFGGRVVVVALIEDGQESARIDQDVQGFAPDFFLSSRASAGPVTA